MRANIAGKTDKSYLKKTSAMTMVMLPCLCAYLQHTNSEHILVIKIGRLLKAEAGHCHQALKSNEYFNMYIPSGKTKRLHKHVKSVIVYTEFTV